MTHLSCLLPNVTVCGASTRRSILLHVFSQTGATVCGTERRLGFKLLGGLETPEKLRPLCRHVASPFYHNGASFSSVVAGTRAHEQLLRKCGANLKNLPYVLYFHPSWRARAPMNTPSKMWGKFEKFALRPLFSSVVAGACAHEQLLAFSSGRKFGRELFPRNGGTIRAVTVQVSLRGVFFATKQSPRYDLRWATLGIALQKSLAMTERAERLLRAQPIGSRELLVSHR